MGDVKLGFSLVDAVAGSKGIRGCQGHSFFSARMTAYSWALHLHINEYLFTGEYVSIQKAVGFKYTY